MGRDSKQKEFIKGQSRITRRLRPNDETCEIMVHQIKSREDNKIVVRSIPRMGKEPGIAPSMITQRRHSPSLSSESKLRISRKMAFYEKMYLQEEEDIFKTIRSLSKKK